MTGKDALNDDNVAARMTAVLGREIRHVQVPIEGVRDSMLGAGVFRWTVDGLVELWQFYETGGAAAMSPDIERVLGRPPRSFDEFIGANRSAFGG